MSGDALRVLRAEGVAHLSCGSAAGNVVLAWASVIAALSELCALHEPAPMTFRAIERLPLQACKLQLCTLSMLVSVSFHI